MLKRLIIRKVLALVLLSLFLLTGCGTGSVDTTPEPTDPNTAFVTEKPTEAPTEEPTAEPTAEPTEPPFVYPSVAPLEIHVYSMDDLVYGTIVSFNPIYLDYCADGDSGWNSIITFKQRMEYGGGYIPAFREAGDFEYAVFDTDAGYRMFIQIQDRPSRGKTLVGSPILIKDVHSYSDFESLKIGDPIEAVAEIDPVAGVIKKAGEIHQLTRDWLKAVRLYGWPTSLHYLTDGVLRIEYNVDENGGMYIRSIKYSEDYVIQSAVDTSTYVNYRLIPCDLPPAWQEVMGG